MGKIFYIEFAKYGSIPKDIIAVRANTAREAQEIASKRRWEFITRESYRQETGKRLRMESNKKNVVRKKPTGGFPKPFKF